jgi:SMP-30/Gluconolactonase/LRE-like region
MCRFNDGAVDRAGRFWVGTLEDGEKNSVGKLIRLDADLTYQSMDQGFLCSNGIAWSLSRRPLDGPSMKSVVVSGRSIRHRPCRRFPAGSRRLSCCCNDRVRDRKIELLAGPGARRGVGVG